MNKKKKLALLCDYGLDDVIATLYLFNYADSFEKIDIVPVAGNFPLEQTFVNAKRILTHLKHIPQNIRIVDTSSVHQKSEALYEIHGKDGMGDILPMFYEEKAPVISYEQWINEVDANYTVISLGPCTVTLDILSKKSPLELIMMAGNISEPSNYNGYEFNHGIDPEAFAQTVKHPHVTASLDTCHCRYCNLNHIEFPTDGLLGKMLARYLEMSKSRNESICSVYDLTAIVYLIHPERFDVKELTDRYGNNVSVLRYIADKPII